MPDPEEQRCVWFWTLRDKKRGGWGGEYKTRCDQTVWWKSHLSPTQCGYEVCPYCAGELSVRKDSKLNACFQITCPLCGYGDSLTGTLDLKTFEEVRRNFFNHDCDDYLRQE